MRPGTAQEQTMDKKNEMLTSVFGRVGRDYGYRDVEATFTAYRDMKVKWSRSYTWISFSVSDYLMDAPEDVLESVAATIFSRIRGDREAHYGDQVTRWVSSADFVRSNQPTYVQRCRGLSLSPKGTHRDLSRVYAGLVDSGLVEEDPDLYMGWGPRSSSRHSGFSSVLMKTVCMSSFLDTDELPDMILEYCLYAQLAHVTMGFDPFTTSRYEEYDRLLRRYPGQAEAELLLKQYNVTL